MEIFDWDATAGNNNATPPNGWPEFMEYSAVNNTAREGMAVLKRFYTAAISGTLVTAGTSTAYTLTSGQTFAAYANGQRFTFVAHVTSTGAVTLNVDGKGAVAIVDARGNALGAGDLVQNGIYEVIKTATTFRIVNSLTSTSLQLQVGNTLRRAITTGGTSTAYTVAGGGLFNPYEDGQLLAFVPHVASGAAPTINIDAQGAEALQDSTGATIATGALRLGVPALAVRRSGAWRVIVDGVTITPYAKTLLDDADAAAARATLVVPGLTVSRNDFVFGTSTLNGDVVRWMPSDWGSGKPYFFLNKTSTPDRWLLGLWDGTDADGTIEVAVTSLLLNGFPILSANNYTDTTFPCGVVAVIQDQKTQNSNGGVNSTTDVARTLNVLTYNKNSAVSLANGTTGVGGTANQFVLPAGTWRIDWRAPAYNSGSHRSIIHNVTDNVTVGIGSNGFSDQNASTDPSQSDSVGTCVFTIAASKTFELRHSTRNSYGGGDGWGFGSNKGTEVFSQVVISAA